MESIKHIFLLFLLLWSGYKEAQGLKIIIEGLKGALSTDVLSLPPQTRHMVLDLTQIRKIDTGAICTSPSLQIVEINFKLNADPPSLTQNMFENCENITELKIFGSLQQPSHLNENVFQNLQTLRSLTLHSYTVERLTKNFLTGLTSLTNLVLSKCGIKEVTSSTFEELKNLEEIKLDGNEISSLQRDLFKNVPHLRRLDLSKNNISNVEWSGFDGLSSLRYLNLGFNQISSFDVGKIVDYMPELEDIEIRHNALDCYTKEKIAAELVEKLNHTVRVVFYDFVFFDYTDCDAEENHRAHLIP